MKIRLMRDDRKWAKYVNTADNMLSRCINMWPDVMGCRLESWRANGSGAVYQLIVRTGKSVQGSTPFKNVNMYMEMETQTT